MHRKFIALIIAAATAITTLTATAAPARANEDFGKVLAGLAALAIIGAAINDAHKDHGPAVTRRSTRPVDDWSRKPAVRPAPVRPLPSAVTRYDLPQQCLRRFEGYRGNSRLLGLTCLQRNYRHTGSLPYACQVNFGNGRHNATGYEPVCLRERGYRITRR